MDLVILENNIVDRVALEKKERDSLSKFACLSENSKGRVIFEEKDLFRTEFQRDRDRIIHSKAFRRLMHKTQVFLSPDGDHFRTRLTHTLEVSQISRTIARALGLNEDLTEAISLGHDLGHTPFGHNGEEVLNKIHKGGFKHNIQSVRVVETIEKNRNGRGMNLTFEVKNGIVNHTGDKLPETLEGQIVKISDRIAYINHDIDDAIRSGVLRQDQLPKRCVDILGNSHRERINFLVMDMVKSSLGKDVISQSPKTRDAMNELRNFMFEKVYHSKEIKTNKKLDMVEKIITGLYQYFTTNPRELPKEFEIIKEKDGIFVATKDYIAGMTDRYATNLFKSMVNEGKILV